MTFTVFLLEKCTRTVFSVSKEQTLSTNKLTSLKAAFSFSWSCICDINGPQMTRTHLAFSETPTKSRSTLSMSGNTSFFLLFILSFLQTHENTISSVSRTEAAEDHGNLSLRGTEQTAALLHASADSTQLWPEGAVTAGSSRVAPPNRSHSLSDHVIERGRVPVPHLLSAHSV